MMMLLCLFIWSGPIMAMATGGCVAPGKLAQPRPLGPGDHWHNICRSSAVPGPALVRVRTQGKLTVETWKIGSDEKNSPQVLLITTSTFPIKYSFIFIFASF